MTMISAGGTSYSAANPFRILSMDGGGIYGLCTAIMLRKLAEQDEEFLSEGNISLFVGTSAGAINALLLAQCENPREEYVLNGKLERFWQEAGIYANVLDPISAYLSLFGVTAFLGSRDLLVLLDEHFHESTLGELHHRVLIDTFDWSGSECPPGENVTWQPKLFDNFLEDRSDRHRRVVDVAYGAGSPPGLRAIRDGLGDGGIFAPNPAMSGLAKAIQHLSTPESEAGDASDLADFVAVIDAFVRIASLREAYLEQWRTFNLGDADAEKIWRAGTLGMLNSVRAALPAALGDKKLAAAVADIRRQIDGLILTVETPGEADLAAAVAGLRCLAQVFVLELDVIKAASDRVTVDDALRLELKALRDLSDDIERADFNAQRIEFFRVLATGAARLYREFRPQAPEVLRRLKLLSVGVCTTKPYYWLKSFNLGSSLFYSLIPTNMSLHDLYPPIYQILLQAPSGSTVLQAAQILGDSFHRLDPPMVGPPYSPPALVATALARFTLLRHWLVQAAYSGAQRKETDAAVAAALSFLRSDQWRGLRFFEK